MDVVESDKLSRAILNQWRNAVRILKDADKLLFIGYSFPKTDFHVKRVLRLVNMIRTEEKKYPLDILMVGKKEDEESYRATIKDIFNIGSDVKTDGFSKFVETLKEAKDFFV